jgi:hypothetical protein
MLASSIVRQGHGHLQLLRPGYVPCIIVRNVYVHPCKIAIGARGLVKMNTYIVSQLCHTIAIQISEGEKW